MKPKSSQSCFFLLLFESFVRSKHDVQAPDTPEGAASVMSCTQNNKIKVSLRDGLSGFLLTGKLTKCFNNRFGQRLKRRKGEGGEDKRNSALFHRQKKVSNIKQNVRKIESASRLQNENERDKILQVLRYIAN